MPTAGSLSLKGVMSRTDAFQIVRLREAGAVMLAKSNMAEFAFDPPHGNNSPRLSPPTGYPSITVPMGFVRESLPVGLQLLGRAWSEPTLIKIAYGYEQATRHRRPPATTPPLPARP